MDRPALETKLPNLRSRSNTTASTRSRKRPLSRASTTSVHSGQPLAEQLVDPATADFHKQWFEQSAHAHQRFGGLHHQMTPEDMVIQTASQIQNPREYDIDPTLGNSNGLSYQETQFRPELGRQSIPTDSYSAHYAESDGQIPGARADEQDDVESVTGGVGPVKKVSKASAANEMEMRQLFMANKHRSLPEVATELHGNERGPQSERQRQVFAMLWINQVCDKGKGSVPRGRVYSNYVSRCATERVTVLNPASFGKLVRVLFPGLKTRRLGVRGESKYHYVNFSLKDDQPELSELQKSQTIAQSLTDSHSFGANFNECVPASYTINRTTFPSADVPPMPEPKPPGKERYVHPQSLYNQPEVQSITQIETCMGKVPQRLHFSALTEQLAAGDEPISLPKIALHIPAGTDPDSASTLTALYRSHCTSLVDALRFCKEKTFFHLFSSFHGTLTMPVQKLFAKHEIASWIEECDFVMYQKMMRVVAPLTLQVAPKPVLDTLRNISERLVSHIQNCFQGHPSHVICAKVAPATLFAGLLDRELRVNLTAHAAANMLSNPANRDQMYEEWITMVRTRKIAECVPTRGMDDVVNLLLTELRYLLNPVGVDWELESKTLYGEMALRTGREQQASTHGDSSTENVLDRWVNFLASLPGKFPYATHAEIVWCVQSVGTAVMRDITIAQGKSFGAWWVTKCWIDEMIAFMAEQGGFMKYKTSVACQHNAERTSWDSRAASNNGSRYSSGGDDYMRDNTTLHRSMSEFHTNDLASQAAINTTTGHDDSGIGIRTPDEEYAMGKYEYGQGTENMQANDLNHDELPVSTIV